MKIDRMIMNEHLSARCLHLLTGAPGISSMETQNC